MTGQHLEQYDSQRIDVRLLGNDASSRLLRRNIVNGPHQRIGTRHRFFSRSNRNSEIRDFNIAVLIH